MIFDASNIYLSFLQKTLLTNDILITVINLIEILPITLHIINSSFYLSSYQSPNEYTKYFKYCSYYDLIQEQFEKGYPLYFFIMMMSILLIFCFYKYIVLRYRIITNVKVNGIFINFFEVIVFKLLSIIIFDVTVHFLLLMSLSYLIVCTLFLSISVFGFIVHFDLNFIYLNLARTKNYVFENKIFIINNKYFIIIKIIICFIKHFTHSEHFNSNIELFLNFFLFLISLIMFIHQCYLFLWDKFVVLSN